MVLGCCHFRTRRDRDVDEAIRKVRMGTLVVEAAPGAEVRVEQLRHEFWFGAALASQMFGGRANAEEAAQYKKVFLENFNAAVTENALKWHAMEPRQGAGGLLHRRCDSPVDRPARDSPARPQHLLGNPQPRSALAEDHGRRHAARDPQGPRPGYREALPGPVRRVRPEQRDAPRRTTTRTAWARRSRGTWPPGSGRETRTPCSS